MSTTAAAASLPPPPTGPRRMSLVHGSRGRIKKPIRACIYGVPGVGKSSFAAGAPSPAFIVAEDGTAELDVFRFPPPQAWGDVFEAISELMDRPHEHRTLVIDTLDALEPMNWAHVCATKRDKRGKPFTDIEALGFGKGYIAALDYWRELLAALERLRAARDMAVILVAHSTIKTFKNPEGDDFDRYCMKIHDKAAALIHEWCDVVLFATHETLTHERDGRTKGIDTGARVVHTVRRAAWDAKNRHDLPDVLPLDWQSFADAVAAHRPADPAAIRERITAQLADVTDAAIVERVRAAVSRVGDNAAELARISSKLAGTLIQQSNDHGGNEP